MTRRKVSRTRQVGPRRKPGGRGRDRSRNGPALFGVVGALVVAAVIAIVATRGSDGSGSSAPARVTVSGGSLPTLPEGGDPAVGLPAPTLEGQDFEGRPMSIEADGRPKAIIFLAHWCPHCQREVPLVQAWLDREGPPADVSLYSVATATDPALPNYPPDAWLAAEGWTLPVLVDDDAGSAASAYGLTGFPFWAFVDADGNVTSRFAGELTIDQLNGYLAAVSG